MQNYTILGKSSYHVPPQQNNATLCKFMQNTCALDLGKRANSRLGQLAEAASHDFKRRCKVALLTFYACSSFLANGVHQASVPSLSLLLVLLLLIAPIMGSYFLP